MRKSLVSVWYPENIIDLELIIVNNDNVYAFLQMNPDSVYSA